MDPSRNKLSVPKQPKLSVSSIANQRRNSRKSSVSIYSIGAARLTFDITPKATQPVQKLKVPKKTLVSDILKKRTHKYHSYDPTAAAFGEGHGEIQILIKNERIKGRIAKDEEELKKDFDLERAKAQRNWAYLKTVAIYIGRQKREVVRREKRRLALETARSKKELEEAEMILQVTDEKIKRKRSSRLASLLPADPDTLADNSSKIRDNRDKFLQDILNRDLASPNDESGMEFVARHSRSLSWKRFKRHDLSSDPRAHWRSKSLSDITSINLDKTTKRTVQRAHNVLNLDTNLETSGSWESFDTELSATNSNQVTSDITAGEIKKVSVQRVAFHHSCISEDHRTNNGIEDAERESITESVQSEIPEGAKRSIFAAPKWDPSVPGSLMKIHKRLMRTPLVYSGVERGVDIPEGYESHDSNKENEVNKFKPRETNAKTKIDKNHKRFVFRSPPVVKKKLEIIADSDFEIVDIKGEEENNDNSDEEKDKKDNIASSAAAEAEELEAAFLKKLQKMDESDDDSFVDLEEEYLRRKQVVEMKRIQIQRLEENTLKFMSKAEVKPPPVIKPREFVHGFSVLPDNYTGKIALNLLYGHHDRIPEEAKIQNSKHQLYVSVTHLFDFSRYEILNKKKPRIAFLLRPYDKSYPYPRGANKYREIELDRRSGVISGSNNSLTFEISPETLLKRCLLIRVKAYKGKVPSDFLGQVLFEFSDYERAEDVAIVDKEAYLYGKFSEVGALDIEMFYKQQQGCLTITIHSANILPSQENPGDTFVRIYHEYMGDLVERVQTEVQAETFIPAYKETFNFKLPRGMIEESVLHFKLLSRPSLTIASDFVIGEVFLAQRTNCDEWKKLFVNCLNTTKVQPVRATVPMMYYY